MTLQGTKDFTNKVLDVTEKKVTKPIIDLLLGKTMSRKLQVLIIATWLVDGGKISGDMWGFIALLYILGIYWLNHVQAMAKLGKDWMGKANNKFGGSGSESEFYSEDNPHHSHKNKH